MKILAIGDPHFKVSDTRLNDIFTERIIKSIEALKPDVTIVLGDILDCHEKIHVFPLTRAISFLSRIENLCPLYLIIGNHDRPNNQDFLSTTHPFTALNNWKNTTVVDHPIRVTIQDRNFTFVPYVFPGRFQEALSKIPDWQNSQAIFAHQEFYHAKFGSNQSEDGDKWPLSYPLVISGHIHDFDELQPNIIYTGTPFQHAFGDRNNKTVSLFTFNNGSYTHERIDLGIPKKLISHFTYEEILKMTSPDQIMSTPGDQVKIVVDCTTPERKALLKMPIIIQLKGKGVKIAFKEHQENSKNSSIAPMTPHLNYLRRLYQASSNDPDLSALYISLFGKPVTQFIVRLS